MYYSICDPAGPKKLILLRVKQEEQQIARKLQTHQNKVANVFISKSAAAEITSTMDT